MAEAASARILISYRRDDVPYAADRIADRLSHHFGPDAVFVDLRAIDTGANWREALSSALDTCDAVLVLIGPHWLRVDDETGESALHRAGDPVRLEIRTAMQRGVVVIPVVVDEGEMPAADVLPDDCAALTDIQAHSVRREGFDHAVQTLIDSIESRAGITASAGRRAGAFTVDVLPFVYVFFRTGWNELAIPAAVLYVLYHWIPVATTGRTLGKLLFGIRVEFLDRSPTRWLQALLRPVTGYPVSTLTLVGLVQFALHRRHATFHDLLFRTRVLREQGGAVPLLLRGIDQVSRGIDRWIQDLLGRWGAFGRLLSYVVTAYFGLAWLLRAWRSLGARVRERGEEKKSEHAARSAPDASTPAAAGPLAAGGSALGAGGASATGLAHTLVGSGLLSVVLAAASLGVYESVVPERASIVGRIQALGVLDLSGTWRFTEVQVTNNGFYRPLDVADSVLVFEHIGRGRFRVQRGPQFLLGSVMSPRLNTESDDLLAVDTLRSRADCVRSSDGSLVASDVYANTATWTFTRAEEPPSDGAETGPAQDRMGFQYRQDGEKDSDDPAAATCRDRSSLEVVAVVRRATEEG